MNAMNGNVNQIRHLVIGESEFCSCCCCCHGIETRIRTLVIGESEFIFLSLLL